MDTTSQDTVVTGHMTQADKEPFIKPTAPPLPTHEAYMYDKTKDMKIIVAQGSEKEIKNFVNQNRKPGKWLYMRKIEVPNPSVEKLNEDMLARE